MFRFYTKVSFAVSSLTIKCVNPSRVNALLIETIVKTNLVILFIIFVPFTIISKAGNQEPPKK
ncbi:hypothetical protein F3K44_08855 [Bacillus megaterium]|nr:hypothetical protein [Priestia megaterium]